VTDLDATSWLQFLYSGLADGGTLTADIFTDPTAGLPTLGLVQVATIVMTDGTNTRTITGSGFVMEIGQGTATPGEAIVGTMAFRFDGIGTPPSAVTAP
jgi:hypothetical protein